MFEKMIGFIKVEDGATAVCTGRQQLKLVLKEEWRAIGVAQQDRAHLATVALNPADSLRARRGALLS